ncbi:MAG: tetratricopeptide repeat protein [Phycisphaeraceae bacterium]|nr:tetratricopeptide repeat protein [Phycisphaeraceae bacterium]MCB9847173.1 tetratricopeptide repeat protein [Phycisphaeraceae bacterium]
MPDELAGDSNPDEQPTLDLPLTEATRHPGPGAVRRNKFAEQIGPFKIIKVLGEGGMGVVYRASQENPRREVALKLIRSGMVSGSMLRRFQLEADILARLQHPGIAKVYQTGLHDGAPYFAMELIEGETLLRYSMDNGLSTRERLRLFGKICDAVEHAHQKGVIHRDLKPGNILVDRSGQPKILDFGVARATDGDIQTTTVQTNIGQLIGTVQYMSPEQAGGDPGEIDTRSDVYALGVILYELLAEQLPYDLSKKMVHEAVRVIREVDPTRISMVQKTLHGDIETIVGKAMEKEKERRYQSAFALAEDVERYLNDEPISARPPSSMYQLRKFAKRNRAIVAGVVAVFLALVAGIIGTGVALNRALDAEALAQDRLVEVEQQKQLADASASEARRRADELQQVAEFQSEQLGTIDAEAMGVQLRASILAAAPEGERASLDAALGGVNFTSIALGTLEANIFERTIGAIDSQFAEQPLVRAKLLQSVAATLHNLSLYELSEDPQERALSIRRGALGDDHPDTLDSINDMGLLLWSLGKLDEAEPYFVEALEGRRRTLGDDHPDTLVSINNVGTLLKSQGKPEQAEPYYRETLERSRRVLGDDHPDTLNSIGNMGYLLKSQGKLSEAEPYYLEALEGQRRTLGDDHPNTLNSINDMGALRRAQGRLSEAEPYFVEALERRRRVLGDDHRSTLISISNLSLLLADLGRGEEALALADEAVGSGERTLGADHWLVGNFNWKRGWALQTLGRYAEAERAMLRSHEILAASLGESHAQTRQVAGHVAELYDAWDEAEPGTGRDALAAAWRGKVE